MNNVAEAISIFEVLQSKKDKKFKDVGQVSIFDI